MPVEKTIMLYQYGELSDEAKEAARDWWLSCRDTQDFEFVVDDFARICEIIGITLDTHEVRLMSGKTRQDPNVWWSVGYCQSDFAAFDGRYSYKLGCLAAIKDYAPKDEKLHAIVADLRKAQALHGYRLSARIKHHDYYGLQLEVSEGDDENADVSAAAYTGIQEAIKDLWRWLYDTLRREDEYQTSEEYVVEAIEANEYTFTEDGERMN